MRTIAYIVALSAFCIAQTGSARAERYSCIAAREIAKVGVHRGNEVGIEEDNDKKECRFSINGATTDSPPQELVIAGLNALITGQMPQMLAVNDVMPLANLLLAPSRFGSPTDQLISTLQTNAKRIAECLLAFQSRSVGFVTEGPDMRCRVVQPGGDFRRFGGIDAEITIPHLQLLIGQGQRNLYLFVPVAYRAGQPLTLP